MKTTIEKKEIVIKIAGDSGDGMQLVGDQFTINTALAGYDLATFPDFPAEIRAPKGTPAGVSGFQIRFSSNEIYTPGDSCDVLVAMNAAALKTNKKYLKTGGMLLTDISGFDSKNLKLAGYEVEYNLLADESLKSFSIQQIDITKLTYTALENTSLDAKEKDRCKNMFVLGLMYWLYERDIEQTKKHIQTKFSKKTEIADANIQVLLAGYNYGETTEQFTSHYHIEKAKIASGTYRNIQGNQAMALGLLAASVKAERDLFFASYPITPASDILHELSKYTQYKNIHVVQAEDEIAAACMAIGASFGGSLGVTSTSGPGFSLKAEAMGLAISAELPLIIIDVQRAGPSTGMPTKVEQADLLQAVYGRHGESPLVVIAPAFPSDCFNCVLEAAQITMNYMVPVVILSDAYIANGSEPWKIPNLEDCNFLNPPQKPTQKAFERNENLARQWVLPGTPNMEYRVGGIEKDSITGNISYDAENHQKMVNLRAQKVQNVADFIAPIEVEDIDADIAIVGWGSTYGSIKSAVQILKEEGYKITHIHLRNLSPMPKNTKDVLEKYKKIIVPELNTGQLSTLLRTNYLFPIEQINKVQGQPFFTEELVQEIKSKM